MGQKNFLIEGVSCAGKTSVCNELNRRGWHAIHGDNELAYWGDPETGAPTTIKAHEHWLWDVAKVRTLVADQSREASFFCGGSRNHRHFIHLFDDVFVLEIDLETLNQRLAQRSADEWSGSPGIGEVNARLQQQTRQGLPEATVWIDATAPLERVVDRILEHVG